MISLFHPGDLGLDGLAMAVAILLVVVGVILIPTIMVLNWLAGKSGDGMNRRRAAKESAEAAEK